MVVNAKEAILSAARSAAQAHGYGGLNFRDLAAAVGIKAASIHYHFPSKADLGAAVARRYWEDTAAELNARLAETSDPRIALQRYPSIFRRSLENENRLCLGSFMSAEFNDLPEAVKQEVQAFADVNISWLAKVLSAISDGDASAHAAHARAIFASVSGAQLLARSRADVALFDGLIDSYQATGLLPA